ncbi:MAG: cadherin-like beta sandwich domain-containing protein [Gemmatimonadaceae bacterium]
MNRAAVLIRMLGVALPLALSACETRTGGFGRITGPTTAALSALTLSSGVLNPSFASGTTVYSASVINATSEITVTPFAAEGTTITVDGAVVPSGSASPTIPLAVGANTVTIGVTSTSGQSATYTLTISRSAGTP